MPNPIDLLKAQNQNYQPFLKNFQQSEDARSEELFSLLTASFPASAANPSLPAQPLDESESNLLRLLNKHHDFFLQLMKLSKQNSTCGVQFVIRRKNQQKPDRITLVSR